MWLLESKLKNKFEEAEASANYAQLEADNATKYEAFLQRRNSDGSPGILSKDGGVARIGIKGVLTEQPSFFAMLFGGGNTTYADINASIQDAQEDSNIKSIELLVDSPGGNVNGLFKTLDAIHATTKPTRAIIQNVAASAAYAIVAQSDDVIADNRAVQVGSVGIVAQVPKQNSEHSVTVTSTNAPNKRPDPETKEGIATIKEELDGIHELFVDAISRGRRVNADKVNSDFGKGSTLLAREALNRGMIDSVKQSQPVQTKRQPPTRKARAMDLNQLKAEFPDVYQAAREDGVVGERDRVNAHLTMGDASGDMKTALAAVEDGADMTATLQAKYLAAGMRKKDVEDREEDDDDANADVEASKQLSKDKTTGDAILKQAAENCGVELHG